MKRGLSMSMSTGVASLLGSALRGITGSIQFSLSGDLSQMAAQERFLVGRGLSVERNDVYPGLFTGADFRKALQLLWENRIDGWWHYEAEYAKYGICDSKKFREALRISCAQNR